MSHPAEKKKRKKNSHEIIAKTGSHRSSHVIDEPCSAAVCETLHVLRWFTASCCVLSLSAHALGAAFFWAARWSHTASVPADVPLNYLPGLQGGCVLTVINLNTPVYVGSCVSTRVTALSLVWWLP